MPAMRAIIPAGGLGKRMHSITGGRPKELLEVAGKTVLARIVDEARSAGATEVVVVSSPEKPELTEVAKAMGCTVVLQQVPQGLGPAVVVAGAESASMLLLGDTIYRGGSPLKRLVELVQVGADAGLAVEPISDEDVSNYGIVESDPSRRVGCIIEKPRPDQTSSREAIAARYVFSLRFLAFAAQNMDRFLADSSRTEVSLTPAMQAAIDLGMNFRSNLLVAPEQRVDCGSVEEYEAAVTLEW